MNSKSLGIKKGCSGYPDEDVNESTMYEVLRTQIHILQGGSKITTQRLSQSYRQSAVPLKKKTMYTVYRLVENMFFVQSFRQPLPK